MAPSRNSTLLTKPPTRARTCTSSTALNRPVNSSQSVTVRLVGCATVTGGGAAAAGWFGLSPQPVRNNSARAGARQNRLRSGFIATSNRSLMPRKGNLRRGRCKTSAQTHFWAAACQAGFGAAVRRVGKGALFAPCPPFTLRMCMRWWARTSARAFARADALCPPYKTSSVGWAKARSSRRAHHSLGDAHAMVGTPIGPRLRASRCALPTLQLFAQRVVDDLLQRRLDAGPLG